MQFPAVEDVSGLDPPQRDRLERVSRTCTPAAFNGVCGCGKSTAVRRMVKASSLEGEPPCLHFFYLRETRTESRGVFEEAQRDDGIDFVSLLGAPDERSGESEGPSQKHLRESLERAFARDNACLARICEDLREAMELELLFESLRLAGQAGQLASESAKSRRCAFGREDG